MENQAPVDMKTALRQAANDGKFSVDSSSLQQVTTPAAAASVAEGNSQAPVPEVAAADSLMQASAPAPSSLLPSGTPSEGFIKEKIEITQEDKNAFLNAIVADTRYTRSFQLYGGRMTGTFRSRTAREHDAAVAYLNVLLKEKKLASDSDYFSHLRAIMLAMQVARFQDTEFDTFAEPLFTKVNAAGEATAPAWLGAYQRWLDIDGRNPGITGPLFAELQKFERKYWTLIACADDPNFWNPAEST